MDSKEVKGLTDTELQTLTLRCLVEMKERTGYDIRKIGEHAVKTPAIKRIIEEFEKLKR